MRYQTDSSIFCNCLWNENIRMRISTVLLGDEKKTWPRPISVSIVFCPRIEYPTFIYVRLNIYIRQTTPHSLYHYALSLSSHRSVPTTSKSFTPRDKHRVKCFRGLPEAYLRVDKIPSHGSSEACKIKKLDTVALNLLGESTNFSFSRVYVRLIFLYFTHRLKFMLHLC